LAASEGHNADAMKRRQPNPPVIRALAELVISPLLSVGRSEGWASGQREHLPNGKFRPNPVIGSTLKWRFVQLFRMGLIQLAVDVANEHT
jgi:hypothetical protein